MTPQIAQDWLNLLVEVSVGVFVFFVSVPALIYSTFIPQELRELRSSSALKHIGSFHRRPFWLTLSIVMLIFGHFILSNLFPSVLEYADTLFLNCDYCIDWGAETSVFSVIVVFIATILFVLLVCSVYLSSKKMKKGYLEIIAQNLSNETIVHYTSAHKLYNVKSAKHWLLWRHKVFSKKSMPQLQASKENEEKKLWDEIQTLGKYANTGRQKHIWLACIGEIILKIADTAPKNVEGLKKAVKMLGDITNESADTANYENIKDTLNIYRNLLNILKAKFTLEELDQFTECYAAIASSLQAFADSAVRKENIPLLFNITSTITLMPNHSSHLFKIAISSLRHQKYEVLAYSFNEIIGKNPDEESRKNNFWGIYAALNLRDGAFHDHAERMRQNAGYPPMDERTLLQAYHYHYGQAHFDVADHLYKLIHRRGKQKPSKALD
jgi:hypothetical protein